MSVNSYLSGLASNLVLSNTEKSNISTSVDTIKTRLSWYFSNEVVEKRFLVHMCEELYYLEKLMKSLTWIL